MIAIDLFSGAGGMSTGAIEAGIDVRFAVDKDRCAAAAYHQNHPHCEMFVDDIRRLSSQKIKQIPRGSDGTLVFGGPPCQGFSYSNTRTRVVDNKNNWLFEDFIRVVKIWQPDFVVFENVQGIVNIARGIILDILIDRLDRLGYILDHGILNAVNFGVPQKRNRFFLIGSRTGNIVKLPEAITTPQPMTVKDAIADLPDLENGASISRLPYGDIPPSEYAKTLRKKLDECSSNLVTKNNDEIIHRYRFVPPGGNWGNIPLHMMKNYKDRNRCHTGIYHRLYYNRPSVVIGNYRKNMLIHPLKNRGLSVREAARIQSFPDSYEFFGSIGFQQQQVADAVPPKLARYVFKQLPVE